MDQPSEESFIKDFELVKALDFADIFIHNEWKIFMIKYHEDQEIDTSKGLIIIEAVRAYIEKGFLLGLSDVTAAHITIDKEARKLYSFNDSLLQTKAQAVVVKNLSLRILINALKKLENPPTPIQLFNSHKKAIDWLRRQEE